MTITEAHLQFKMILDKNDSLNYPNLLPEEIDLFLNMAQEIFIKQRYGITNTKKQGIETTQKRTEDLKALIKNAVLTPLANTSENIDANANFVTLPEDHWFIIEERCDIIYNDCKNKSTSSRVKVITINHDEFYNCMENPYRKPNTEGVLRLMENGKVELIHSSDSVVNKYYLRYLKEPIKVDISTNTTFELSPHTHSEIINIGVDMCLEDLESKRIQSHSQLITNTQE